MKKRSEDSDDIERAVYDGMQDLRVPRQAGSRKGSGAASNSRKASARRVRRARSSSKPPS